MKFKIGNTQIEVISNATLNEKKENLEYIYDMVHNIANQMYEMGDILNDWFYSQDELEDLKKCNDIRIIN